MKIFNTFSLVVVALAAFVGTSSGVGATSKDLPVAEIKFEQVSPEESIVADALLLLKVRVKVDGVDTEQLKPQEAEFFNHCFAHAMTAHDKPSHHDDLEGLVVGMDHQTLTDGRRSLRVRPNMPRLADFSAYITMECRYCPSWRRRQLETVSRSHYKELEEAFCDELRNGPHQVFRQVSVCSIDFNKN